MKINGINKVYETYKSQITSNIEKTKKTTEKDQVNLSENAKDFSTIYRMLSDVPEVRTQKVEEIKESMDSGNYHVTAADVAAKILSLGEIKG